MTFGSTLITSATQLHEFTATRVSIATVTIDGSHNLHLPPIINCCQATVVITTTFLFRCSLSFGGNMMSNFGGTDLNLRVRPVNWQFIRLLFRLIQSLQWEIFERSFKWGARLVFHL